MSSIQIYISHFNLSKINILLLFAAVKMENVSATLCRFLLFEYKGVSRSCITKPKPMDLLYFFFSLIISNGKDNQRTCRSIFFPPRAEEPFSRRREFPGCDKNKKIKIN